MADFQFQGQQWSDKNPVLGTGEGEVPLAKQMPDVNMRTMASDVSSIKEMGGGDPRPYAPKEMPASPMPARKEVVVPPIIPPVVPPQPDAASPMMPEGGIQGAPEKKKSNSGIFVGVAVFVTLIGLAAVVYFFVLPMFLSDNSGPVDEGTPPAQEQVVPPAEEPVVPPAELPAATSTEGGPEAGLPKMPVVEVHASLFATPADLSAEATLGEVTVDAVKKAFEASLVEVPVLREMVFKGSDGKVLAFENIVPLFVPGTFSSTTSALFSSDATFFSYTDSKGVWPGFALKLASDADLAAAKTAIQTMETNNEFASLFLTSPGTPTTWKDGKVNDAAARYIPFSVQGVAFNYAWFDRTLVVSTSYAGAQAAAKKF